MRLTRQQTDEAILRELGSRLAATRLARDLTQAALAREAGVSKRTVERLESGEVATRLSGLVRVCRVLDLMERLDALVPYAEPTPVEQLTRASRERKRASRRRAPGSKSRKWTWGDGS
jgi:transcriptional regulator with XRE-family HTH domain